MDGPRATGSSCFYPEWYMGIWDDGIGKITLQSFTLNPIKVFHRSSSPGRYLSMRFPRSTELWQELRLDLSHTVQQLRKPIIDWQMHGGAYAQCVGNGILPCAHPCLIFWLIRIVWVVSYLRSMPYPAYRAFFPNSYIDYFDYALHTQSIRSCFCTISISTVAPSRFFGLSYLAKSATPLDCLISLDWPCPRIALRALGKDLAQLWCIPKMKDRRSSPLLLFWSSVFFSSLVRHEPGAMRFSRSFLYASWT